MDIEDYERDRAEKKLLLKLQEAEEAVKDGEGWLNEYSNAIVHAFQGFRAPFSGKIVHIFPEQSAAFN